MLYTSPNRGILYPVATSGEPPHDTATHVFEHLACFLPGLFALGAHTLPLDDLPSLGINFTALADSLSPESQDDYQRLAQYKLSDVHRWAARGLGEACAVLYADQPTGLSPDEAFMQTDPRPILWIDELDNWSMGGRRGRPPNTTPIKPAPHVSVQHRGEKDYGVRRAGYELRPEVIIVAPFAAYNLVDSSLARLLSRCTFCGAPLAKRTGESMAGIYFSPSSSRAKRMSDMPLFCP